MVSSATIVIRVPTVGEGIALGGVAAVPWLPLAIPLLILGRRFVRRRLSLARAIVVSPAPPPAPPLPTDPGTAPPSV